MTALTKAGRKIARLRADLAAAMAEAREIALTALQGGETEVDVARELGVDRMTVRKWRGKR